MEDYFKDKNAFRTEDIAAFYEKFDKQVKQSTLNWRVYTLINKGVLSRIGKGKFKLGDSKKYIPVVSHRMITLYKKIKKEFPFTSICVWHTSVFNEFMTHQPFRFYLIIEAEKEATESVFYYLKDMRHPVFLNPTMDILEKYLPEENDALIVKALATESPVLNIEGLNTVSLEKALVDIFCDKVIFSAQQGSEMRTIFNEAFLKYAVNLSRMLRYADRRRKKESLLEYINSFPDLQSLINISSKP